MERFQLANAAPMVGSVTRKSQPNTGFRSELQSANNSISTSRTDVRLTWKRDASGGPFSPLDWTSIRGDWATWPRNKIDHFVLARLAEQLTHRVRIATCAACVFGFDRTASNLRTNSGIREVILHHTRTSRRSIAPTRPHSGEQ